MWGRASTTGLLLLAVTCGCGGGADDPTVLSAGRWGAEFAAVECARIFACCQATENQLRANYADEAECRVMYAAEQQADLNSALRFGELTYDAKAARRCVDELASAPSCADLWHFGFVLYAPSCYAVKRAPSHIGAPCAVGCGLDEYCDAAAQTCAPRKDVGAACADVSECAVPLICASGTCGPPLPGGDACAAHLDCASSICTNGTCYAMQCDGL
jgi:hypothetical protein